MSNYTKTTNFGAKDTLPSGDSQKIIRGTEFDTEFNNIATAVATKLEVDGSNNLAISGTFSATKIIPTGGTAAGNGLYLPAANTLALSVNSTEAVRVNSSGNVGIKTATPQNELDVFSSGGSTRIGIRATESISRSPELAFLFGTDANSNNNTLAHIRATPTQVDPSPLKADLLFATNTGDSVVTAMRLDSSGNLGFNFVPNTWANGFKAIQLQGSSLYANGFNNINLSSNVAGGVDAGGNGGLYGNTQAAARYQQLYGAHFWYTAPSGTIGTAITFNQRMVLNNDGHLGLGNSPGFTWGTGTKDAIALEIGDGYASGSIASDAPYGFFNVLHNVRWNGTDWIYASSAAALRYSTDRTNGAHVFETAPVGTSTTVATLTERLRIRQSGNTQITSTSGGSPVNTADTSALRLRSTATAGVNVGPVILFEGQTGNVTANHGFGAIQGVKLSAAAADYSGGLAFFTQSAGGTTALNEQMRLTPTGLGIGITSPTEKLQVVGNTRIQQSNFQNPVLYISQGAITTGNSCQIIFQDQLTNTTASITAYGSAYGSNRNYALGFATNGVERVLLNESGNLGLGSTPSAWGNNFRAFSINRSYVAAYASDDGIFVGTNAFNNNTTWTYITNDYASRYDQQSGQHKWFTAASGTAGGVISFSQRMTLDTTGNLGIGTTSPSSNLHISATTPDIKIVSTTTTGTTIGDKGNRLLFESNSSTTGNGGEVVFLASDTDVDRWAAVSGSIRTNTASGCTGNIVLATKAVETDTALVSRMVVKYLGQVRFVPLSADPALSEAGDVYYNSTSNKLRVYNGTAWVDLH